MKIKRMKTENSVKNIQNQKYFQEFKIMEILFKPDRVRGQVYTSWAGQAGWSLARSGC